ncbi:acyl carrier protein [Streptomyces sp. ISL-100]|uniref:acyl carrier protein n=1 Tax=Streptomyces sp. ISL-100 TaxID=2819173 RepID=UPI001BEA466E|nr:acyl carrier protein [Streptomyces sp. ISL-100]MBT2396900.1 acyl carrier protein [Streptomyces sp. ISL-100]
MTTTADLTDETSVQVVEIISGVLSTTPGQLREEPLLGTYNWDSLTTLEALVALEGSFGIEIDLRALHSQRTIGDLVALVKSVRDGR